MLWWEINNATSAWIYSCLVITGLVHTAIMQTAEEIPKKFYLRLTNESSNLLVWKWIWNAYLQNRWVCTINCFLFIIGIKNSYSQLRSTTSHRIYSWISVETETWPQDFSVSKKWSEEEIFLLRLAHTQTRLNFCRESKINGIYFSELLYQHILELYFIPPCMMIYLTLSFAGKY